MGADGTVTGMELRTLGIDDIGLFAEIDRSEIIRTGYTVDDGALVEHDVMWDTPAWDREGDGDHSVARRVAEWGAYVADGADFVGCFDGEEVMGLLIVDPTFEGDMAWFAVLHVSRPYRRTGAGSMLWDEAVRLSKAAGATSMYVSATPSQSAVGFYRSKGAVLADPPHPKLFEMEPEDIHFVVPL
jgi:GNAT superfamily N-acetyltransferase